MRCRPTLWFSNDGTFSYSRDHLRSGGEVFGGDQNLLLLVCGTGFWALGADPGLCFSGFQTVRGWRDAVRSPVRMTLLQPKSSRSQMDLMSKASSCAG